MAHADFETTIFVSKHYKEPVTEEQLNEVFRYAATSATALKTEIVVITQGGVKLTFRPQT